MHLAGRLHFCLQLSPRFFHLSPPLLQLRGHSYPYNPYSNAHQQQWTTTAESSKATSSPQQQHPPFSSTLLRTKGIMASAADTSSNAPRRERVAQAAERRLREAATTVAVSTRSALSSSSSPSHAATAVIAASSAPASTTNSDTKGEHVSSFRGGDCRGGPGGVGAGSRKRKAASGQQVGFSDSDDSESEVTCVGNSTAAAALAVRATKSARGGEDAVAARGGRGATGNQRGRKDGAVTDPAAAAASAGAEALGARAAGRDGGARAATSSSSSSSSMPHTPKAFRVVSWNIDCLNGENKMARVEEVCAILLESEPTPDVILLQEVDGDMLAVLNARLGAGGRYQAYPEAPVGSRYYTLMFVKVGTVTVQGSGREGFTNSRMGRDLASIRATFNGKPILIMTSHLETQFNQVLQRLLGFREGAAIFAGDTNLREAEVKQEKLAKEAGDMWQLCGADPERRFTWDMAKNDNHVFGGGFQPRARYDRMFVNSLAVGFAKTFALLGTQRMAPPHSCFPSDHFGMDARFEY
ncbi:unnamed protein product [Pylaiella littoralis]